MSLLLDLARDVQPQQVLGMSTYTDALPLLCWVIVMLVQVLSWSRNAHIENKHGLVTQQVASLRTLLESVREEGGGGRGNGGWGRRAATLARGPVMTPVSGFRRGGLAVAGVPRVRPWRRRESCPCE